MSAQPEVRLHSCPALNANLHGDYDRSEALLRTLGDIRDPRVRFDLAWHELRHGHFAKGMEYLAAGRLIGCYGGPRVECNAPIYEADSGVDLNGKTVLFYCEGGLGDQIISARFVTPLAERGARVVLSCSKSLVSLLGRIAGVSIVVDAEAIPYIHCDYWVPGSTAAKHLGFDLETLPSSPYLCATEELREKWRQRLPAAERRVGLRWRGDPLFEHEQHRDFDPGMMFDWARKQPAGSVVSVQRDAGSELAPLDGSVLNLAGHLTTWDDTAAVLSLCDTVVTSCTSVAHCAAALGVKTFVIVPLLCFFPWLPLKPTSYWYDSVRVFRQVRYGSWDEPLAEALGAIW